MKSTLIKGRTINTMVYMGQALNILKSAYEKSGKSYTDIYNETGLVQSLISKIINGKQYASLSMLFKVGQAVGLEPKKLAEAWKKDKIAEIDVEIAKFLETT